VHLWDGRGMVAIGSGQGGEVRQTMVLFGSSSSRGEGDKLLRW